jgi:hypothetical protein
LIFPETFEIKYLDCLENRRELTIANQINPKTQIIQKEFPAFKMVKNCTIANRLKGYKNQRKKI